MRGHGLLSGVLCSLFRSTAPMRMVDNLDPDAEPITFTVQSKAKGEVDGFDAKEVKQQKR